MFGKTLPLTILVVFFVSIALPAPAEASRKQSSHPEIPPVPSAVAEGGRGAVDEGHPAVAGSRVSRPGLLEFLFGARAVSAVGEQSAARIGIDDRMLDAVRLAERSARSRSIDRCWRYVKRALQEAGVVACYPRTAFARQAAVELPQRYGFKEIGVSDPFEAPVGSVLVYGGRGPGHVELRTETGFVSDHASRKPSSRPLIGVFVKPLEG